MNIINIALAIYQLEHELERELKYRNIKFEKRDRLYFLDSQYCPIFAQVTWINCKKENIASIGDGIKKLKAAGRNWALFTISNHRRAQLIQDGLYKVKDTPIPFHPSIHSSTPKCSNKHSGRTEEKPVRGECLQSKSIEPYGLPKYTMGGWTLLDANTIIYSTETTSRYPLGKVEFVENKTIPPSRAYLKLWEFFTVHCYPPKPNTKVIDMGSCPGGWSWVLSQLNLNVISVDKAPLDEEIAKIPNIKFVKESAFAIDPKSMPGIEWFFSDIICYPERLLTLIKKWMQEAGVKHFVCTIKFQGEADFKVIDEFLKIPNSKIVHLYHNKHEVMWWVNLQ